MLEKIANGLGNYFLGKDIIEYYKRIEKEHPEHIKEFKKDKRDYLIYGKVIPNLGDISAIALTFFGHPFYGAVDIGISEAIRKSFSESFQDQKSDYELDFAFERINKTIDRINPTLDKIIQNLQIKK
jgi:hypothetical protein